MTEVPPFRRLVYRHTQGSWKGIDQIVGYVTPDRFVYLTTREARSHQGPVPDVLAPVVMSPDGRIAKGMRLRTTNRYVHYQEAEAR